MIRIPSRRLPPEALKELEKYQAEVNTKPDFAARVDAAAAKFRQRNKPGNATFGHVRRTLTTMCAGAKRCMYCEDSAADEVEHHRPKNLYPEHVFVWENYLYACGTCNGPKRNHFMVFAADGSAVDVTWKPGQPVTPPAAGEPLLR
jgi:hypothetical protein